MLSGVYPSFERPAFATSTVRVPPLDTYNKVHVYMYIHVHTCSIIVVKIRSYFFNRLISSSSTSSGCKGLRESHVQSPHSKRKSLRIRCNTLTSCGHFEGLHGNKQIPWLHPFHGTLFIICGPVYKLYLVPSLIRSR